MLNTGRILLIVGALLAFGSSCSDDIPLAVFDPAIADVAFIPAAAREGEIVTVTARYSSPNNTRANAFWSTLFAVDPTSVDFTAAVPVREDCTDCVISGQFILRQSRGTQDVDVFVVDDMGRSSNGVTVTFTALP